MSNDSCFYYFGFQAKRPTKASSFSEPGAPLSGPPGGQQPLSLNRASKNLRRSRNTMGRGLPKKGKRRNRIKKIRKRSLKDLLARWKFYHEVDLLHYTAVIDLDLGLTYTHTLSSWVLVLVLNWGEILGFSSPSHPHYRCISVWFQTCF